MTNFGENILQFKSLPSTNDYIKQRMCADLKEGTLVVADQQTKGRGRGANKWISGPGVGLYFSFFIKPHFEPKYLGIFSLSISVAVANALSGKTNRKIYVKWPNDLFLQNKKIGGILVESTTNAKKIEQIVVGIGLNLLQKKNELPHEMAGSILSLTGLHLNKKIVLNSVVSNLNNLFSVIQNQKKWPQIVQKNWTNLCCHLNKSIQMKNNELDVFGKFEGITEYAEAIIIGSDGNKKIVTMGEFSLREV
jgi:BirA family transcriptional regulator, biotin operon repressor / biotin---[acetyl-CoA-carboxylase] ligase